MGNTVSYGCYERWGKRTPDGPLIQFDPRKSNNGSLSHLIENFDYNVEVKEQLYDAQIQEGGENIYVNELNGTLVQNRKHSGYNSNRIYNNSNYNSNYNSNNNNSNNIYLNSNNTDDSNISNTKFIDPDVQKTLRVSRRRPTYSPSTKRVEAYSDEGEEDKLSTDNSEEKLTASDIKAQKIRQYRKILTKVVKIKTAIFHETVKVTCSKDGKMLEWYKGKSDANGKKKPIGHIPLNKITSVRTKSDNLKYLEINVNSANIISYLFIFKTRDEREEWQSNLESFKKIMSMK